MANNKKPKKKYKPGLVRAPSMVAGMNSFEPFEKALKDVIETGTVQTDVLGTPIYFDSLGNSQSFASALMIYTRITEIYATRNKLDIDLKPLNRLYATLMDLKVLDEEEVEIALKSLEICKRIISTIKPSELFDIFKSIKISIAMKDIPNETTTIDNHL